MGHVAHAVCLPPPHTHSHTRAVTWTGHREPSFLGSQYFTVLSTLRRIIRRKSSVKIFKSSANPASPFPNKPTVENDPYPFPNVQYPCQCSEQHGHYWNYCSLLRYPVSYY